MIFQLTGILNTHTHTIHTAHPIFPCRRTPGWIAKISADSPINSLVEHGLEVEDPNQHFCGELQSVLLTLEVLLGEGESGAGPDHHRVAVRQVRHVQPPVGEPVDP